MQVIISKDDNSIRDECQREVSKDLGINESSLHKWKKDYLSDQQNAFPGKGSMKPEEEELRRVKKQLARVTMQRDI